MSSYKGKDFRISAQPSEHNLYHEDFRFTLKHPRGNSKETAFFIYSEASRNQSFATSKLDPSIYRKFPLDVVVLNNERVGRNSRRVYLIDRSNYGPMISLHDHGNVTCCKGKQTFSFYAHNVTVGKKTFLFFNDVLKRTLLLFVRLSYNFYEYRSNNTPLRSMHS